jgi:hypothetical protein
MSDPICMQLNHAEAMDEEPRPEAALPVYSFAYDQNVAPEHEHIFHLGDTVQPVAGVVRRRGARGRLHHRGGEASRSRVRNGSCGWRRRVVPALRAPRCAQAAQVFAIQACRHPQARRAAAWAVPHHACRVAGVPLRCMQRESESMQPDVACMCVVHVWVLCRHSSPRTMQHVWHTHA